MYYKTKEEIQKRLKEISDQIEYADDNHSYKRKSDGKYLHGVSSVVAQINKPYLVPWASKENYNYMMANWDLKKKYAQKEKGELLYRAKNAYKEKSDVAKTLGKDLHTLAEKYIKLIIAEKKGVLKTTSKEMKHGLEQFLKWNKETKVDWIASEGLVFSNYYDTAGTFDGLGYINGHLTLIDIKVAKIIGEDYFLQLAGYQMMLEEWGIEPIQRLIIQVPKEVDKFLNQIVVPTPYELDRRAFLGALEIKRSKGHYKSNIQGSKVVMLRK